MNDRARWSVDEVIELLDRHRQRVTYGALADVVGGTAGSVMSGRPRNRRNSWVVSSTDGEPTGYRPDERHPELKANPVVIEDAAALISWLAAQEDSASRPNVLAPLERAYTVVYQRIENGWYMATVPDVPGAVTQGRTLEEAREMIREAVPLVLQSYRENALKSAAPDAICETLSIPA